MNELHSWDVSPKEAVRIQHRLQDEIQLAPLSDQIERVGGADISYNLGSDQLYAGVIVLQLPELSVVEESVVVGTMTFPYVPGLLSFREAPMILRAFDQLTARPDVLVCDGQGIAHPRGIGIASHLGVWLDYPTVGCAKSRLTGDFDATALSETAGSSTPLYSQAGYAIGAVVRTKRRTKPVFVSPGYKADIASSQALIVQCCRGYRLPEPTRLAHHLVNRVRREHTEGEQ